MKTSFLTLTLFFLWAAGLYAQEESKAPVSNMLENNNNINQLVSGNVIQVSRLQSLEGDNYLDPTWRLATLILKDGSAKSVAKARYNAATNDVEVLFPNDSVLTVNDGINQFVLTANSAKPEQTFRSGFPAYAGNTKKTFYEVLYDGKQKVLVRYQKVLQRDNTEGAYRTGEKTDRLVLKKNYFLYSADGKMSDFDNTKKAFLQKFAEKKDALEKFVKENKLNYREHDDIKRIMSFLEGNEQKQP